ncbi:MAG: CsgG/HfaB family protein [Proteobacteria bacterium]|nr:CsgG/HfaB family protein [Pseudomonadota bacterium]MBU1739651.1 CsgG/HfaB family protein [Pseudomonadota bacterium]
MLSRLWIAGGICFGLSLVLCSGAMISDAFADPAKARVAVADFALEGKGHSVPELGAMLAELLTEELVRQGRIQVVERTLLKKILEEKKMAMAGLTSGDSAAVGALLGVDYILGGSDLRPDETSDLSGRLIDVRTGVIVATEDIPYHEKDDLKEVARNLAEMLGRNFGPDGIFQAKKQVEGSWEAFASDGSHSRFLEKAGGGGSWSYRVSDGAEDYAGLTRYLDSHEIKGRTLLITCRAKNGHPLYVRFYSFVPGFSKEDDDESLVPVEKLVDIGRVAVEIEAPHHRMRVPDWWRKEKKAHDVTFNPDDIRHFEIEAGDEESEGTVKDVVEIIRVSVQ